MIAPPFRPIDGEEIITDGVQAGTGYQARATITTTPARPVFWTEWVAITAPALHVIPAQSIEATVIDAENIIGQIVTGQIAAAG